MTEYEKQQESEKSLFRKKFQAKCRERLSNYRPFKDAKELKDSFFVNHAFVVINIDTFKGYMITKATRDYVELEGMKVSREELFNNYFFMGDKSPCGVKIDG